MRRSFLPVMLACVSVASFAHAQPVFRPLDSTMQVTPAAKPAAIVPAPVATPTPQVLTAPAPTPRAHAARNGEIIDSVGSNAIPALPLEVMTNNGVSYISGGIGDEEKSQLEQQESQYNLRLLITGMNGEYMSNVRFILNDATTKVLIDIPDAGPFVYMLVPAGHYTVQALAPNGSGKAMPVKVPAGGSLKGQIRL